MCFLIDYELLLLTLMRLSYVIKLFQHTLVCILQFFELDGGLRIIHHLTLLQHRCLSPQLWHLLRKVRLWWHYHLRRQFPNLTLIQLHLRVLLLYHRSHLVKDLTLLELLLCFELHIR
jgi:hypothetical protein